MCHKTLCTMPPNPLVAPHMCLYAAFNENAKFQFDHGKSCTHQWHVSISSHLLLIQKKLCFFFVNYIIIYYLLKVFSDSERSV